MTEQQSKNISLLFMKFQVLWRDKWTRDISSIEFENELKETWISALKGLTGQQIETALDMCRKSFSWPVTPPEFRCLAIGAVTPCEAWQAVRANDLTNPYVFHAAQKVGSWTLKHSSEQEARKQFLATYLNCTKNEQLRESSFKAIRSSPEINPLSLIIRGDYNATEDSSGSNRAIPEAYKEQHSHDKSEISKLEEDAVQKKNNEELRRIRLLSIPVYELNTLSKEDQIDWLMYDSQKRWNSENRAQLTTLKTGYA